MAEEAFYPFRLTRFKSQQPEPPSNVQLSLPPKQQFSRSALGRGIDEASKVGTSKAKDIGEDLQWFHLTFSASLQLTFSALNIKFFDPGRRRHGRPSHSSPVSALPFGPQFRLNLSHGHAATQQQQSLHQ